MIKEFFKSFKFLILILSLLSLFSVLSCNKKSETSGNALTPSCGVGSGSYYFSEITSLPQIFDCNTTEIFSIELSPYFDPSYSGFNRLYFELEKDWTVYRSNYVELNSGNYATQQLEFGGSLPSGTYEATAYLQNIQLNSTCKDSIYWTYECWLGNIDITQFSSPQKIMNIEYNYQWSDTSVYPFISYYDVFLSPNTSDYIDIAFNIANTRDSINFINYYAPELIFDSLPFVMSYIYNHKQSCEHMFLEGIKGFKNASGILNIYTAGATVFPPDTVNFTPNCYTGSLVAVKAAINYSAMHYKVDFNDLVTLTTIHELAHQRGIYRHHDDFSNPPRPSCAMNKYSVYPSFNPYSNPHFCDECINKIKNINW